MNVKKIFCELELEADVDYSPERPAPPCQDHDSPRFSDPGDSEEMEIIDMHFVAIDENGRRKLVKIPDELMEFICDTVSSEIIEQCRLQYEMREADSVFSA